MALPLKPGNIPNNGKSVFGSGQKLGNDKGPGIPGPSPTVCPSCPSDRLESVRPSYLFDSPNDLTAFTQAGQFC